MLLNRIFPRLFRPPVYQGKKKPDNYFEGWYFKLVDTSGKHIWSVIPGVSYSGDPHCFVQVVHANAGKSYYIRYPVESFRYSRREFFVGVGANEFSSDRISLNINSKELSMNGELIIDGVHPFPSGLLSPGIMGWYGYMPFMECYHGVVSMQHRIGGSLNINQSITSFDGGKGYIEKDWGRSMPSDWIWIQSNHFKEDDNASFMLSVARIPWIKGFFPGFLSFLLLDGKVYRFATYNRSVIESMEVADAHVKVVLKNRKYRLKVTGLRLEGSVLKAPRHGAMDREIKESIVSTVSLELRNLAGELLYGDKGLYAGLEIVGDVEQYFQNKSR